MGKTIEQVLTASVLLCRREGTTIKHLMDRLDVEERTIYRIFKCIESTGLQIVNSTIPGSRERVYKTKSPKDSPLAEPLFNETDQVMLKLLLDLPQPGAGYEEWKKDFKKKLKKQLPS
jgi:transcriptional antiterminator